MEGSRVMTLITIVEYVHAKSLIDILGFPYSSKLTI